MEEDNMRRPPANDAQYIALLSGDAWLEIGQLLDAMTRGIWEREMPFVLCLHKTRIRQDRKRTFLSVQNSEEQEMSQS